MRRLWAVVALVAMVAITAACQVEVDIDVVVDDSGSAAVTLTAVADAALLAQAPRLASDLRFDDLVAVGWKLEGPVPTADGGLQVRLRREIDSLVALEAVLAELGAPVRDLRVERADEFARSTWEVTGRALVEGGTAGLVDVDAVNLLGAAPFAIDLTDAGLELSDVLDVTLRMRLPGDLVRTSGDSTDGVITWNLPVDGTQVTLTASTERVDRGAEIARTTADITRFVFVVWMVVAGTFVVWVILARRRRKHRSLARRATPPA